jgi:hypothetical protein
MKVTLNGCCLTFSFYCYVAGICEHLLFSLITKTGIVSSSQSHFLKVCVNISFYIIVCHLNWGSLANRVTRLQPTG